MTIEEAIQRLEYHAGSADMVLPTPSFIGMLRPFAGLRKEAFDDVMACIRAIAPFIRNNGSLPRGLVGSLWAIVWYARYWALSPDGMLQRNQLISDAERETLALWVDQLSASVSQLLDGASDEEAFAKP